VCNQVVSLSGMWCAIMLFLYPECGVQSYCFSIRNVVCNHVASLSGMWCAIILILYPECGLQSCCFSIRNVMCNHIDSLSRMWCAIILLLYPECGVQSYCFSIRNVVCYHVVSLSGMWCVIILILYPECGVQSCCLSIRNANECLEYVTLHVCNIQLMSNDLSCVVVDALLQGKISDPIQHIILSLYFRNCNYRSLYLLPTQLLTCQKYFFLSMCDVKMFLTFTSLNMVLL
jgi:hypothetical protein